MDGIEPWYYHVPWHYHVPGTPQYYHDTAMVTANPTMVEGAYMVVLSE